MAIDTASLPPRHAWDRHALYADLSAQVREFSAKRALQFVSTIPTRDLREAWASDGSFVRFTMTFDDGTEAEFEVTPRRMTVQ